MPCKLLRAECSCRWDALELRALVVGHREVVPADLPDLRANSALDVAHF